jgi:hypothetical protein
VSTLYTGLVVAKENGKEGQKEGDSEMPKTVNKSS